MSAIQEYILEWLKGRFIEMKHILCYGDSNTYGFMPLGGRYNENTRWTCLLAKHLGKDYRIIDEGLNGRTVCQDDPFDRFRNGLTYLIPCLQSHLPVDLTILMLGSNDLKQYFNPSVEKISDGLYRLGQIAKEMTLAPVLLVSPILLEKESAVIGPTFSAESIAISRGLAPALREQAERLGISFMDAAKYAKASPRDGLHLPPEGHRALADAFYQKIQEILSGQGRQE